MTGSRSSASTTSVPERTTQGGNIVKSKVLISVVAVIGLVALSVTGAQAAGNIPISIPSFFVCNGISNAASPPGPLVLNVFSSVFGSTPQNITIGNGVLACVLATLTDTKGNKISPTPLTGSATQEGLKCYSFSGSLKSAAGPKNNYTVTDHFVVDPNVQVNQIQYICAPGNFLLNFP